MRLWTTLTLLVTGLVSANAKDVSFKVVVRDHLTSKSTEVQLTAKLWDSTAGSWVGTRPGIDGLPLTQPWAEGGYMKYRKPLSPTVAQVGWPGRIAARLDATKYTDTHQRCSAALVGPKYAITATHCVLYPYAATIQDGWVTDTLTLRPGYNLGQSAPGFDRVRVLRTWVARTKFADVPSYGGDDEWAILELEKDVGTELGWARVVPINYQQPEQWIHMMGYPLVNDNCSGSKNCDTTSKTDTLCHSWGELYYEPDLGTILPWVPMTDVWGGESGSGAFRCPDDSCHTGKINLFGVRWTNTGLGSLDSVMSGVLAAILKDVKVPTAEVASVGRSGFGMHLEDGFLQASAEHDGEWQILSLDGRAIGTLSFGRTLSVAADRLPRGVALVVFREPGQAPVTRRWVGR